MEQRIKARIAEIEEAERDTVLQLRVMKTLLAELRALIAPDVLPVPPPDAPTISGDALGEPAP